MKAPRFTPARREQFLQLLESGQSVSTAAGEVGLSRNTIQSWVNRGKTETAQADAREFSSEYRRILDSRPKKKRRATPQALVAEHEAGRLSESQLLGLLEEAAQNLNVPAIKILLDRLEPADASSHEETKPLSILDELQSLRARKHGS